MAKKRAAKYGDAVNRRCPVCESVIDPSVTMRAVCCSSACSVKYQNRQRAKAKVQALQANRPPCKWCGEEIPAARHSGAIYCSPRCKGNAQSARWREKAPHYMRQYVYGITREEFEARLAAQDNRCAICRSDEWVGKHNVPHVDHDHDTGEIRGLLCGRCNAGIGQFQDDPELLRRAIDYLRRPHR